MTAPLRDSALAHAQRVSPSSSSLSSTALSSFGLVGRATALAGAVDLARKVAGSPTTTVLIGGETGTGKELVARGIHDHGTAAGAPFVAVNCSAIPDSLLEAELFGHEAGAFTDARAARPGLVESARGGTLFLDEIGELPLALQPKLLRLLEERTARRLGGTKEYTAHCRIIAGTNVRLEHAVAAGHFREDLYYRLNVVRIDLPPLRERRGDILLLAEHFAREIAARRGGPAKLIDSGAAERLEAHPWPGNVRELRNVMERATLLAPGRTLGAVDLHLDGQAVVALTGPGAPEVGRISIPIGGKSLAEIEREAIRVTMLMTAGNLSAAARVLGISRPTLTRRLRESGLTRRSLLASS
jgi:two-component system response regulator HydG